MAYGFNDDNTKAYFVNEISIKPNSGETYRDFRLRVWGILNNIPRGNIVSIFFRLNNTTDEYWPMTLPAYKENGDLKPIIDLTANTTSLGYTNCQFRTINFASSDANMTPNFYKISVINESGFSYNSSGRTKDLVVNDTDAGMEILLYYIP